MKFRMYLYGRWPEHLNRSKSLWVILHSKKQMNCSPLHPTISLGSMCVDIPNQCYLIHRIALNNLRPAPESVIYKGESHDSAGVLVSV